MNKAQERLKELMVEYMQAGFGSDTQEYEFLTKCSEAWEGYDDMQYSYPHWQLRRLEKDYGTTVADIKEKLDSRNKHMKSDPKETYAVVIKALREKGEEFVRGVVYGQSNGETVAITNFINSRMHADEIINKLK